MTLVVGGINLLRQLAGSLIAGNSDDVISKLVEKKLESMGDEVVHQLIGQLLGPTFRIGEAIQTGGASEFERLRQQWLNKLTPKPIPGTGLINKFNRELQKSINARSRPTTGYWKWSPSRKEWLNQDWKHNWRTQPRDYHGRWTKGRLRHPYISKKARRIRGARRRLARKLVREIMK